MRELNNFNGINEVIAALNCGAVYRLKKTFDLLAEKHTETLQQLRDMMSHSNAYKKMRDELRNCSPPCIPYIGLFQTDLTFLEDGNKDLTENGLINFHKRTLFASVLIDIHTYQQAPFNIEEVPYLNEILSNKIFDDLMDDDTQYNLSLEFEPRGK